MMIDPNKDAFYLFKTYVKAGRGAEGGLVGACKDLLVTLHFLTQARLLLAEAFNLIGPGEWRTKYALWVSEFHKAIGKTQDE
jgi:hypothetical protein